MEFDKALHLQKAKMTEMIGTNYERGHRWEDD